MAQLGPAAMECDVQLTTATQQKKQKACGD